MFTKEDISKYYDVSKSHYRRVWKLDKNRSLHYGYWDESVDTFDDALQRINQVLADIATIEAGEKVLDAGCGIGGSSTWLARERNCNVIGISLNKNQVDEANEFVSKNGLADKVFFEHKDYTNTFYPGESFDVVWAIESVCYADDKGMFLKEASRILKPGGRLIVADFFKKADLTGEDAEAVQKWASGWAVNDFSTIEDFHLKLKANQFTQIDIKNVTEAIMRSAAKLYRSFFIGILGSKLYNIFNPAATTFGRNNVENAYLQYKTLRKGLWTYQIVKAVKPT